MIFSARRWMFLVLYNLGPGDGAWHSKSALPESRVPAAKMPGNTGILGTLKLNSSKFRKWNLALYRWYSFVFNPEDILDCVMIVCIMMWGMDSFKINTDAACVSSWGISAHQPLKLLKAMATKGLLHGNFERWETTGNRAKLVGMLQKGYEKE